MADVGFAESPTMRGTLPRSRKRRGSFDGESATPARRTPRTNAYNSQQAQNQQQQDTADLFASTDAAQGNPFDLSALNDDGNHNNNTSAHSHNASAPTGSSQNAAAESSAAAAAALHQQGYSMTVPGHPGDGFGEIPTAGAPGEGNSFNAPGQDAAGGEFDDGMAPTTPGGTRASPGNKPAVGTEEWHKVRKDNHKEVERRRRETINEGINELAKIVPGCEKNKGSILARAVQYIQKLQDDASTNIDKWTFEKLVTEQAIAEISEKCQRAYAERNAWKRVAMEAGVDVENVDLGIEDHGPTEGDKKDVGDKDAEGDVQRHGDKDGVEMGEGEPTEA